ncbi:MAG TPA: protein-glutamate O-methyltransferase CheR [Bryobacteraceae bacterium]
MIKLLPAEQAVVFEYIHSICGIALDASKTYLVEGRLSSLAERYGCVSFHQLMARAHADPSRGVERAIIDAITTNETLFFRDGAPFDLLRHKLIPELVDRHNRTSSSRIRIWSAACSTGQELYSIAILLKELLGDPERYGVQLLGTDISDEAVARASKGLFGLVEISRGLSEEMRTKFFTARSGGWQIRDEIRAMATFRKLNLLQDFSVLGRFDVIFCRNVAIYFNDADRRSLFQRLGRALEPGGCLVIGSMESLTGIAPQFESKRHLRSVYYQSSSFHASRPAIGANPPKLNAFRPGV